MRGTLTGVTGTAGLLLALWLALVALLLGPGRLSISAIEGDTLHALDGALRMAAGAVPHLDFSTPLGLLAFGGLALPLGLGAGPGHAMLMANLGVAAALLPALVWLRATRMGFGMALLLGAWALVEAAALVYDSPQATLSYALHYNRWCWAVLTVLFALLVFPAERERPFGDGLVLGLGLAFLALTKMTYLAGLALPALVWLLGGRRWRTLGVTVAAGLAPAAAVTLWAGGPDFWRAYLGDLLLVATSAGRSRPGVSLAEVLSAPAFFMGTFALVAGIALLRMAGQKERGLLLLAALPGFVFIAYQNWGNAPVWLAALVLLLIDAHRVAPPERRVGPWPVRPMFGALALVAITQFAPFVANAVASPFRHLGAEGEDYVAALTVPGSGDLLFLAERGQRIRAEVPLGTPAVKEGDAQAAFDQLPTEFLGRSFPPCHTLAGLAAQMRMRAAALAALPEVAGGAFLTADLLNVTWMFTGGQPLVAGSPWYYGGSKGLDAPRWIVVPQCPLSTLARGLMLEALTAGGDRFEERFADDVLVVYERIR